MLRLTAALVALLSLPCARVAEASLSRTADAVARHAEREGATVTHHGSLFLESGEPHAVSLGAAPGCVTLVILGERSTVFSALTFSGQPADTHVRELLAGESKQRLVSESGALIVISCGDSAQKGALIALTSTRGALEVLALRSPLPIEGLPEVVGRTPAPKPPPLDLGPALRPAPLKERRKRAEERAKAEGATNVLPLELEAGPNGSGEIALRLPAGCHRLDVMPDGELSTDGPRHGVDLDADLRSADGGELIARDRGETPDARLDVCVGETTMLTLAFRGALPGGRVVLHDAFFPIPRWARERHGPRALAAQVQAERRRLATASPGPTLFETLGAQGSTQVTVEVERGSCYLATLALIRGTSRGLRLMARASAVTSYEEVPAPGEGAAVTFCADQDRVTLSADVPGVSVSWVLSLLALTPRPRPEGQQP